MRTSMNASMPLKPFARWHAVFGVIAWCHWGVVLPPGVKRALGGAAGCTDADHMTPRLYLRTVLTLNK